MIIIVDGNYLAYRTFHKSPPLTNSKGVPTSVIHGVTQSIVSLRDKMNPDKLYVVFDAKGKNRRHEQYPEYKATRERMPEDLAVQMEELQELLRLLGFAVYVVDGYEADDVIHTLAKGSDDEVLLVTKDKDLYQLVNDKIKIYDNQTDTYIDEDGVVAKFGVSADKVLEMLALIGDKADNIPGVKGIGEKTAAQLLNEFGSLDGIYENIESQKGKKKENLINDKENAYLSKKLAELDYVVNIEHPISEYKESKALEKIQELELNTLHKRLFGGKRKSAEIKEGDVKDIKIALYIDRVVYVTDGNNYQEYDGSDLSSAEYYYDIKGLLKAGMKIKKDAAGLHVISWMNDPDGGGLKKAKDEEPAMFIKRICEVYEDEVEALESNELKDLYYDMELPVTYLLKEMEDKGVRLSAEKISATADKLRNRIAEVYQNIANVVGYDINVNSPKQLSVFLYDELGIMAVKKTKTGYSTNEDALREMLIYNPDKAEVIGNILKYREYSKVLSTYTQALLDYISPETGRIHADFNQTGTATGRLSSTNPNMQNLPQKGDFGKEIREAFIPAEGYTFLSLDYSQIELRILAHLTEDENLLKAYRNGDDIHSLTAANIFHVNQEDVSSDMRRMAKAVNFGIVYGLSAYGLSRDTGVNPKEAGEFINKYFATYPGVKNFIDEVTEESKKRGYGMTICGRKRFMKDIASRNKTVAKRGERVAVNTPMQGSAADIIKLAMISCDKIIKENKFDAKLILQLHDELVFEVKDEEAGKLFPMLKESMESVFELRVPLVVNGSMGKNLGELK